MKGSIVGLSLVVLLLVPIVSVYAAEIDPVKLADVGKIVKEKFAKQAADAKSREDVKKQQQADAEQQRITQLSEPAPTQPKTSKNPEVEALKIKIAELEKRIAVLEKLIQSLKLSSN